MEEHITDALQEVDQAKQQAKEFEVAGWMFNNVMSFALYAHDAIWPIGPRLDPDFTPMGFADIRVVHSYEYIKAR